MLVETSDNLHWLPNAIFYISYCDSLKMEAFQKFTKTSQRSHLLNINPNPSITWRALMHFINTRKTSFTLAQCDRQSFAKTRNWPRWYMIRLVILHICYQVEKIQDPLRNAQNLILLLLGHMLPWSILITHRKVLCVENWKLHLNTKEIITRPKSGMLIKSDMHT